MKQGKVTEAGEKFLEAYIAEPYNRLARAGFVNWGDKVNVNLAHPRVELPANVSQKPGETTLTIDPNMFGKDKNGSAVAWVTYGLTRTSWQEEFAKQYPNEKTYRHSLKEEAAAMRAALKVLSEQKGGDANKIDPALQVIRKLEKEGLLEAVYSARASRRGHRQRFSCLSQSQCRKSAPLCEVVRDDGRRQTDKSV